MSHSSSRWCSNTSNERKYREISLVVGRKPLSSLFLSSATDFSNHDDALGLWIINEALKHVDEVGSVEWVTSNAYYSRLSKAKTSCLVNGFVSESARPGNNSDLALLMDIAWHDSNLAFTWFDNTGAVGSNESSFILALYDRFHFYHI